MKQVSKKVYYIVYRFNKSGRISHLGADFFFDSAKADAYAKEMIDLGIFDDKNYHPCVESLCTCHE